MTRIAALLGVWVLLAPPCFAQEEKKPPPANVKKAMDAVEEHLAKRGGKNAMLLWKDEAAVAATFPEHVFVIARFRIYPIARELPEGLHPSNIFAVTKDAKVEHIGNVKALEKFFGLHNKNFNTERTVKDGLASWLALTQEFHQDGLFKFEVLEKEIAVEKMKEDFQARGRALVTGGGKGEIAATAQFSRGQLTSVLEMAKVMAGPRPICQATKLLDADEIVRKMAERDLLFMGLAARDYLMEQREKAGPDLRRAIDQLWERIVKNGW